MAKDNQPKLRLIKTGAGKSKPTTLIAGNQFFPAIPASCELLPKLRFMRVEVSLMLCIQYPGEHDFKQLSSAPHLAKVVLAPAPVKELTDADHSNAKHGWPHKAPLDLHSLNARSLRGIMELAQEPSMFHPETEEIVEKAFRAGCLDQSISKRAVWENVRAKCREAGIKSPTYRLVAMRIDCMFSNEVMRFHPLTRDTFSENPGGYPSD